MYEKFWFGNLQKIKDLEDIDIGGKIILKCFLSTARHT